MNDSTAGRRAASTHCVTTTDREAVSHLATLAASINRRALRLSSMCSLAECFGESQIKAELIHGVVGVVAETADRIAADSKVIWDYFRAQQFSAGGCRHE